MRPLTLLLLPLVACTAPTGDAGERTAQTSARFTSAEAALWNFEFDGRLTTTTTAAVNPRSAILAQLMYSVGHLNADRSVGRFERLELSAIATRDDGSSGTTEIQYHARLPVAWAGTSGPDAYRLTLPARVAPDEQVAFAAKYGTTCVDPSTGPADVDHMFLFYRPHEAGCALAADDVTTFDVTASSATSTAAAPDTYPEYDRIWEDGTLEIVVLFSRDADPPAADDEGARAYATFRDRARSYIAALESDPAKRVDRDDELGTSLAAGIRVTIHPRLVGPRIEDEGAAFDAWFDAVTPSADVILYNGHAGLGENVRALATRGTFRPRKYVLWAVNGCDTFAYADGTLASRRALLNPDDPSGTQYMDQVSNVMAGYFGDGAPFAMTFMDAMVEARSGTAMTYREILEQLDPKQVVVVTGDEDNRYRPPAPDPAVTKPPLAVTLTTSADAPRESRSARASGCEIGTPESTTFFSTPAVAAVALVLRRRRRR